MFPSLPLAVAFRGSVIRSLDQSINQSISQSIDQSVSQSINPSINQPIKSNQSTNPTNLPAMGYARRLITTCRYNHHLNTFFVGPPAYGQQKSFKPFWHRSPVSGTNELEFQVEVRVKLPHFQVQNTCRVINPTLPLQQRLTLQLPGACACRPDLIPRDEVRWRYATRRRPTINTARGILSRPNWYSIRTQWLRVT